MALALALAPATALAVSMSIQMDGVYGDWTPAPFAVTDPAGDAGGSGIDFTSLQIAHDQGRLFLRFNTGVEVQPDELHNITIAIDTDRNTATGAAIGTLGAELVWNIGQRSGTFHSGGTFAVGHAAIGLLVSPTVSATEFEVALDRNAIPAGGNALFPNLSFTLAILDNTGGGDRIVLGMPGYTFDATAQPVPSLPLGRISPSHVRIAAYNIENDGLFAGGARAAAQNRLFDAINPDVWTIGEVWNHTAAQVAAQVEVLLPSGAGQAWYAVKIDPGNAIVSRFPILQSWDVLPGSRLTAALLDPGPAHATDLLVVANHWSCCTADANRQNQADALIAFLRDARTAGGAITLAANTPIIAAGDFNLVGWRAQLVTLLTGDIANNAMWGADSPPDWDGSTFDEAPARHPDARLTHTWRDDLSSFYPGRLDYMLHTASVSQVQHAYVLDTRSMTVSNLAAHGLQAGDTGIASDHAPLVADFTLGGAIAGVPIDDETATIALAPPAPNPSRGATLIRFRLRDPGPVELTVHDVRGRLVRVLARDHRSPGTHLVQWDARDARGASTPSGIYYFSLKANGETVSQRGVVIR
jgi:endonuclease/exonuclease/phosphatase family metal-dependent hydrolase